MATLPQFCQKSTFWNIYLSLSPRIHKWMLCSKAVGWGKGVSKREVAAVPALCALCWLHHMQNAFRPISYMGFYLQVRKCTYFFRKIFSLWVIFSVSKWMDSFLLASNVTFRPPFPGNWACCIFISLVSNTKMKWLILVFSGAKLSCFTLVYHFSWSILTTCIHFLCCATSVARWLLAKRAKSKTGKPKAMLFWWFGKVRQLGQGST